MPHFRAILLVNLRKWLDICEKSYYYPDQVPSNPWNNLATRHQSCHRYRLSSQLRRSSPAHIGEARECLSIDKFNTLIRSFLPNNLDTLSLELHTASLHLNQKILNV